MLIKIIKMHVSSQKLSRAWVRPDVCFWPPLFFFLSYSQKCNNFRVSVGTPPEEKETRILLLLLLLLHFAHLHFFCFSFVLGRNSIVYNKCILGFVEDCSFFQQQEEEEEEEEEKKELLCMW
jgi:hypothetical protein